ncbi:hypothetical protein HIM_06313 [Hirsutella minnesotensis 3608]|uniref:Up-regulated in Daf-2 domain-containing protein n=1 Tax=Hirsutella minnesotensis 3608 TaxID=1043627 RepID=A0A0F7ZZJ0_9HYPO|nr:hypothetical protein HIM_06313 [Hirsutella minnesotensis 3608]
MKFQTLVFDILVFLTFLDTTVAKTRRTALVRVHNKTPYTITEVEVQHKYSNNYKNRHSWESIPSGQKSVTFEVEYNTGAFTTGRDWWFVSWLDQNQKTFAFSNPKNFRRIFDAFDNFAGARGGRDSLFNSESTSGFKQHILRKEDANEVTEIIISQGDTDNIVFASRSGKSTTGSKHVEIHDGGRRPFWAIAHRVLDERGIDAALAHGV